MKVVSAFCLILPHGGLAVSKAPAQAAAENQPSIDVQPEQSPPMTDEIAKLKLACAAKIRAQLEKIHSQWEEERMNMTEEQKRMLEEEGKRKREELERELAELKAWWKGRENWPTVPPPPQLWQPMHVAKREDPVFDRDPDAQQVDESFRQLVPSVKLSPDETMATWALWRYVGGSHQDGSIVQFANYQYAYYTILYPIDKNGNAPRIGKRARSKSLLGRTKNLLQFAGRGFHSVRDELPNVWRDWRVGARRRPAVIMELIRIAFLWKETFESAARKTPVLHQNYDMALRVFELVLSETHNRLAADKIDLDNYLAEMQLWQRDIDAFRIGLFEQDASITEVDLTDFYAERWAGKSQRKWSFSFIFTEGVQPACTLADGDFEDGHFDQDHVGQTFMAVSAGQLARVVKNADQFSEFLRSAKRGYKEGDKIVFYMKDSTLPQEEDIVAAKESDEDSWESLIPDDELVEKKKAEFRKSWLHRRDTFGSIRFNADGFIETKPPSTLMASTVDGINGSNSQRVRRESLIADDKESDEDSWESLIPDDEVSTTPTLAECTTLPQPHQWGEAHPSIFFDAELKTKRVRRESPIPDDKESDEDSLECLSPDDEQVLGADGEKGILLRRDTFGPIKHNRELRQRLGEVLIPDDEDRATIQEPVDELLPSACC